MTPAFGWVALAFIVAGVTLDHSGRFRRPPRRPIGPPWLPDLLIAGGILIAALLIIQP